MTAYDPSAALRWLTGPARRAAEALCRCGHDQQRIAAELDRAGAVLMLRCAVVEANAVLGIVDEGDEDRRAMAALTVLELEDAYVRASIEGLEGL